MALKVVLQSRLGWPFEARAGLDSTFQEVLDQFAASTGWHPGVFSVYCGDNLVMPSQKLSSQTSGSSGMLLCHVSTPDDNSAHRVWEKVRMRAGELMSEVTKDAFFQPHGLDRISACLP